MIKYKWLLFIYLLLVGCSTSVKPGGAHSEIKEEPQKSIVYLGEMTLPELMDLLEQYVPSLQGISVDKLEIGHHQVELDKEILDYELSSSQQSVNSLITLDHQAGIDLNYPNSQRVVLKSDALTLVNKMFRLNEEDVPDDLIEVPIEWTTYHDQQLIRQIAYDETMNLLKRAHQEGIDLQVTSCYRSYALQRSIYLRYLQQDSQDQVDTYSARPGHSEHQLGLACDFGSKTQVLSDFTGTPAQQWLAKHAHEFGYIWRYQEDMIDKTGYQPESWHYRYVGPKAAKIMYELHWALEDYLK